LATPQIKPTLVTTSESIHRRVADSKRRVCEVAARHFNSYGYDATTIESITNEAGIARSTFYRFFQDKEDIIRQMVNPVFHQARVRLEQVDLDKPEDIVNEIADCYLEIWHDQRDALIFSINIGMALFPLVQPAHDAYAEVIQRLMQRVDEARMLRNDDARLATMMTARMTIHCLQICERHENFENVFRNTLRGMLLKW
jgi:AcrR family transcriptional regulator